MKSLTFREEQVLALREKGHSQRQIAEMLGISRRSVRGALGRCDAKLEIDPAVREIMDTIGTGLQPKTLWLKGKHYSAQVVPPQTTEAEVLEQLREAFQDVPAVPEIARETAVDVEKMNVFPLFDAHLGLRAHEGVSGEEMDLERGVERLLSGMTALIKDAPPAYRAVIINGGDFTHQTDDLNRTRKSGHVLDVDGRNYFTVVEAVQVITASIEMALKTHEVVEYYSVPGNHDPQNWETILIALSVRYENNPRVEIYQNFERPGASEFSVVEHGEVALFIHHGDKRTPKDLGMFCAAEFPDVWGRTRFRTVLTGHLHHTKVDEFPGIYWMQLPALAARDSHAAGGYKSHSLIHCITFDRESESSRITRKL